MSEPMNVGLKLKPWRAVLVWWHALSAITKKGKIPDTMKVRPKSGDELYVSYEEGVYRFGGKVTKTFVAEILI